MARPKGISDDDVRALLGRGLSHRDVARQLGITHQAVTYLARSRRPVCPACGAKLRLVAVRAVAAYDDGLRAVERQPLKTSKGQDA